jgi:hypothetical protein
MPHPNACTGKPPAAPSVRAHLAPSRGSPLASALSVALVLALSVVTGPAPRSGQRLGTARADEPDTRSPSLRPRRHAEQDVRGGARPSRLEDPVSERGRRASGLYFTGPFVRIHGAQGVVRTVRGAWVDAAVIDIKDDQGRVLFATSVPELARSRVPMLGDVRALVDTLHQAGIYAIARIVCFNDPIVPRAMPERAVLDARPRRNGRPWVSWGTGNTWLDPANEDNQEMLRRLAVEVAALGFDEIQFDYVRFPVDRGVEWAHFPAKRDGVRHWRYIADFLRKVDESIDLPIGIDIFGVAALREGDPAGLGQLPEELSRYVEVFSPMLYANSFKSWTPSPGVERGASFVAAATARLRERLGDESVIRPFLQGFAAGTDRFDEEFIAGQVRAARSSSANGFLFWNPASNFGTVARALRAPRLRALLPFPDPRARDGTPAMP